MKQKRLKIVALAMATLIALPAFAQTPDIRSKVEVKNSRINSTTTNRTTDGNIRADFNAQGVQNKIQSRIKVYTASANRLDRLVSRIESRMAKIKTAGGNMAEAEASLNIGKAKLVEARTYIAAFSAFDVASATSSTTVRALLDTIKENAVKAKEALKASHRALVKVITLIQGLEKTVKVNDSEVKVEN